MSCNISTSDSGEIPKALASGTKSSGKSESSWSFVTLLTILVARLGFGVIWITGIAIATYEIFEAALEHSNLIRKWLTIPGPFINQPRDKSDVTWDVTVIDLFFKKQLFWFIGYAQISQLSRMMYPKRWLLISTLFSMAFLPTVLGIYATIYVFCLPLVNWFLMFTRSKTIIWAYTIGQFFLLTYGPFFELIIPDEIYDRSQRADFLLICTISWSVSRCVSFCMETWNRPMELTCVQSFKSLLYYNFYFPLVICGPLVLYHRFEKDVEAATNGSYQQFSCRNLFQLVPNILRMAVWVILYELAAHFLYIRPLALTAAVLGKLNCWALAGIVYGVSQCFMLLIGVVFGIPSCVAEFDGIDPGGLPSCPGHVHRYSHAWRNFDKGLYAFLVRYIYVPTAQAFERFNPDNKLTSTVTKKMLASLTTFIFIYIWHGVTTAIFMWAMLNFVEVTIEMLGSHVKRRLDAKYQFDPMFWDFFIEPLTSAPLAAMAILVNVSFVLNPTACLNLTKCLWENGCWLYVYFFCVCFAQVGITVRTWKFFWPALCRSYYENYANRDEKIKMTIKAHPE